MREVERTELGQRLSALGGREGDIQRITEIVSAIEAEDWEGAQRLLLARRVEVAEAFSRLIRERDTLLKAWRLRLQGLPERDFIRLDLEMEQMTIGNVKDGLRMLFIQRLLKFLNAFTRILMKLFIALIFAAVAALVHHLIAARIESAFDGWWRQYFALAAFIFIYGMTEKRIERVFDRLIVAIRRWGLYVEAERAYVDEITLRQMETALAGVRTAITTPPAQ